jgi:hypothetical protein
MATLTNRKREEHAREFHVDEHERATSRLEAAIAAEHALCDKYEQTLGTAQELDSYMRFREARRRVSACGKWLQWVEDEDSPTAPPAEDVPLDGVLGH